LALRQLSQVLALHGSESPNPPILTFRTIWLSRHLIHLIHPSGSRGSRPQCDREERPDRATPRKPPRGPCCQTLGCGASPTLNESQGRSGGPRGGRWSSFRCEERCGSCHCDRENACPFSISRRQFESWDRSYLRGSEWGVEQPSGFPIHQALKKIPSGTGLAGIRYLAGSRGGITLNGAFRDGGPDRDNFQGCAANSITHRVCLGLEVRMRRSDSRSGVFRHGSFLLDHMRQFVAEKTLARAGSRRVGPGTEHQMASDGVGVRTHRIRGIVRCSVCMDSNRAELVTKLRLHECARGHVKRLPGRSQHVTYNRRHSGRLAGPRHFSLQDSLPLLPALRALSARVRLPATGAFAL